MFIAKFVFIYDSSMAISSNCYIKVTFEGYIRQKCQSSNFFIISPKCVRIFTPEAHKATKSSGFRSPTKIFKVKYLKDICAEMLHGYQIYLKRSYRLFAICRPTTL